MLAPVALAAVLVAVALQAGAVSAALCQTGNTLVNTGGQVIGNYWFMQAFQNQGQGYWATEAKFRFAQDGANVSWGVYNRSLTGGTAPWNRPDTLLSGGFLTSQNDVWVSVPLSPPVWLDTGDVVWIAFKSDVTLDVNPYDAVQAYRLTFGFVTDPTPPATVAATGLPDERYQLGAQWQMYLGTSSGDACPCEGSAPETSIIANQPGSVNVVGCPTTITNTTPSVLSQACGAGYEVCATRDDAIRAGLTAATCRDSAVVGNRFFMMGESGTGGGVCQGGGFNDIFGCGANASWISVVPQNDNCMDMASMTSGNFATAPAGSWSLADPSIFDEYINARLADPAYGGVLCCRSGAVVTTGSTTGTTATTGSTTGTTGTTTGASTGTTGTTGFVIPPPPPDGAQCRSGSLGGMTGSGQHPADTWFIQTIYNGGGQGFYANVAKFRFGSAANITFGLWTTRASGGVAPWRRPDRLLATGNVTTVADTWVSGNFSQPIWVATDAIMWLGFNSPVPIDYNFDASAGTWELRFPAPIANGVPTVISNPEPSELYRTRGFTQAYVSSTSAPDNACPCAGSDPATAIVADEPAAGLVNVVGCPAPINNTAPAALSDVCGAGFEVCPSRTGAVAAGLTPETCRNATVLGSDRFFMMAQSGDGFGRCDGLGTNDIFGCGANPAWMSVVPLSDNCPSMASMTSDNFANAPNGSWYLASNNASTVIFEEYTYARLADATYGGVLCCRSAILPQPVTTGTTGSTTGSTTGTTGTTGVVEVDAAPAASVASAALGLAALYAVAA